MGRNGRRPRGRSIARKLRIGARCRCFLGADSPRGTVCSRDPPRNAASRELGPEFRTFAVPIQPIAYLIGALRRYLCAAAASRAAKRSPHSATQNLTGGERGSALLHCTRNPLPRALRHAANAATSLPPQVLVPRREMRQNKARRGGRLPDGAPLTKGTGLAAADRE